MRKDDKYILEKPWYVNYVSAKQRCNYKKHTSYKNYGAKGILMLLTLDDVENLWHRDNAGAMERPSLDRINRLGNYEIDNCRFIEHRKNVSISISLRWEKWHKLNRWSIKHGSCIECGTTKRKHSGKGLCDICYGRTWKRNHRKAVEDERT